MAKRGSGILLHITSLPSPFGIGDMGPGAYQFADFLASAKQKYWQVLPLNPTDPFLANSPYLSSSAFAGNALLISPQLLLRDGLLTEADLATAPAFPNNRVDFPAVINFKKRILRTAYERFKATWQKDDYDAFCNEHGYWLDDFSLFVALKNQLQGRMWNEWPDALRKRNADVLQSARNDLRDAAEEQSFLQYILLRQWTSLKNYCNQREIEIIGDLPIFVGHDSVDVWAHSALFDLDESMNPRVVAGVPPDYFSKTGQRWGNPLYRWEVLKMNGYEWWYQRLRHSLNRFDWVRMDHFRGFVAYWEISAGEKTAVNGRWVQAPAEDFFNRMKERIPQVRIIAEDLGFITPEVRETMERLRFPGMKVLLFAFGDDVAANPYAPHNHRRNCVVYTGTHDNNTIRGWFENDAAPEEKKQLFRYLGKEVTPNEINEALIRLGMMSVANTVIFPIQDILGLGPEARMNQPATQSGNWEWRILPEQLTFSASVMLREMAEIFGRT